MRKFIRELIGWLIIGAVILILATMAGYFSVSEAGAKPRPTPCETIVEGLERCGHTLRTAVARPGQRNVPRRETPTRRAK